MNIQIKSKQALNDINNALEDYIKSNMELIKSVEVEDDKIVKEEFHSDLKELSPLSEEEQYEMLMNTFLNRKDKRKLSKFKGKLSFTDRMYARKK